MKKLAEKFETLEYFILKDTILQKIFHFPSQKNFSLNFIFWGEFFDISKNNIICVETTKGWQLFLKFQII